MSPLNWSSQDAAPEALRLQRIRVLIIGPSLSVLGGQALEAQRLLRYLKGVPELDVAFLAVNPELPGPFRLLQKLKYMRTAATSLAYWTNLLRTVPHYHILHVFSASYWSFLIAPAPALMVGKLFGKRTLLNYRSGEAEDHLARWRLSRRLVRQFEAIVVSSEYLVKVFGKFNFATSAIPNIIDLDHFPFHRRDQLRPVFLSNRNFEPLYNVKCTLKAYALIARSYPQARLHVVGYGSQRVMLQRYASSLRLPNVTFHGKVPPERMSEYYDGADILLNSSNIDNMPSSILEAQASGLPVATTNAGGIPYIVSHEHTGLLVPCDDHEALAHAAIRYLEEPLLAAHVIEQGRRAVEIYRPEIVCQLYLKGYQTLARRAGPRHAESL